MNRYLIATLIAVASLAGTVTNDDTAADQATADTVLDRAAESAQLQADVLFAEVSHGR